MKHLYAALPAVDACLTALAAESTLADCPRAFLREAVTLFLDNRRAAIAASTQGLHEDALRLPTLLPALTAFVREHALPRMRRVLNATGVVIHTNMGRSVLAAEAAQAVALAATGYCSVELDLTTGGRGSRTRLTEDALRHVTGAQAALVVNNNAAAVLLVLDSLCRGGEVIVSRGQLVEIGGSFRIPEVMEKSGAQLREVGTTNRTHLHDYAQAITHATVALLRVHTSNYRIVGFHSEVPVEELSRLAQEHNVPLIEDLGSGSLLDLTPFGLPGEPTARAVLRAGADIVTFSGDKVLGGPQAGIIAGKAVLMERIRSNPLYRALRVDKLTLAALEATLRLYADPERALAAIPTLRMMTLPPPVLLTRAKALLRRLRRSLGTSAVCALREGFSRVGGGAFPERDLPTTLIRIIPTHGSATAFKERLLRTDPPLMGRLDTDAFCLDVRTLDEAEWPLAVRVVRDALIHTQNHNSPA